MQDGPCKALNPAKCFRTATDYTPFIVDIYHIFIRKTPLPMHTETSPPMAMWPWPCSASPNTLKEHPHTPLAVSLNMFAKGTPGEPHHSSLSPFRRWKEPVVPVRLGEVHDKEGHWYVSSSIYSSRCPNYLQTRPPQRPSILIFTAKDDIF